MHRRAAGPGSRAAELVLARSHTAAGLSQGRGQLAQALHFEFRGLVWNAGLFHETLSSKRANRHQMPVWTMKTFNVFTRIAMSNLLERWSI